MKNLLLVVSAISLISLPVFADFSDYLFMPFWQDLEIKVEGQTQRISLSSPHGGSPLLTDVKKSADWLDTSDDFSDLPGDLVKTIMKSIGGIKNLDKFYIIKNFVDSANLGDHGHSMHTTSLSDNQTAFYIAIIDKTNNPLENVIFQVERFKTGAGIHNQVRFQFKESFTIIPQFVEGDKYPPLSSKNGDLTYTLQAIRSEDGQQEWDPIKGLMGEYANALQFYSTEALTKIQIRPELENGRITNNVIENHRVPQLTLSDKIAIFEQALNNAENERRDNAGEYGIYNTIFNSCVVHAMKAMHGGLLQVDPYHFNPYTALDSIKTANGGYLEKMEDSNSEFQHLYDQQLMTMQDLQQLPQYRAAEALMDTIKDPKFDELLRSIALLIVKKDITYDQVGDVLLAIQADEPIKSVASTEAGQALINEMVGFFQTKFPGSDPKDLFAALAKLRTQE